MKGRHITRTTFPDGSAIAELWLATVDPCRAFSFSVDRVRSVLDWFWGVVGCESFTLMYHCL